MMMREVVELEDGDEKARRSSRAQEELYGEIKLGRIRTGVEVVGADIFAVCVFSQSIARSGISRTRSSTGEVSGSCRVSSL